MTDASLERSAATDTGAFDVVCVSHLRWTFVWQRPQHLLSRCARERRVLFVEHPLREGAEPRIEVRRHGDVVVATPTVPADLPPEQLEAVQAALLTRFLDEQDVRRYVLWYYDPLDLPHTRALRPLARIYDCMDQVGSFADALPGAAEAELELFGCVDLVFTGGRSLYDDKRGLHPRVHLFPSSVDRGHFARARDGLPEPPEMASLPRPRLGWFGVIEERVDLELLAGLARARPDWQIVMVGPVVRLADDALPREPNLHFLGMRRYEELPAYLGAWDVALMPFALNRSTTFISPTKTLEYLAGGRPVVSTPVRDVVEPYGSAGAVEIATGVDGFVEAVERVLAGDGRARRTAAEGLLEDTSWDATWAAMRSLMVDVVAAADAAATGPRRTTTTPVPSAPEPGTIDRTDTEEQP